MADSNQPPPEPDGDAIMDQKPSPVEMQRSFSQTTDGDGGGETGKSPQVISMEAVSVTDPSQLSADVQALLKNPDFDPYDEDEAELRFLHSKPTCFIIVGKPGSGKTTIAKRLAMEWKCEMINATELLQQAIEMQTEDGVKCQSILLKGEAVPEDVVFKMVEDKVNSPEVAHHGYVLDDFPSLSEEVMSITDQLELVKNWKMKPDFIINLKIPDKDLEHRRRNQKVDPMTGDIYTVDVYNPDRPVKEQRREREEGEEEEEEEEAEEEEMENEDGDSAQELPPEVVERLVVRPEDLEAEVDKNIRKFKTNLLRMLEEYMADHDQEYLIEMDSNQTSMTLFKQLLTRLNCFVLRPAAVPIRLHDPEEEDLPEDMETDELMRQLAPKQMVAPRFRWRRSRWLRNCPVALHEGDILPGKPDLAVSFLDKVYCLSSGEAMEKFLKNPRPYLLPPQPRPPCKISVLGAPLSGKTSFCRLLAQKYGGKVLDMQEMIKPHLEVEKKKAIEVAKAEATESAIATVRAKLKEQQDAEIAAKEAAEAAAREKQALEEEELEAQRAENQDGEDDEDGEEKEDSGEITPAESKEEGDSAAKDTDTSKTEDEKTKEEDKPSSDGEKTGEGDLSGRTGEDKTDESSLTAPGGESAGEQASESLSVPQPPPEVDETHPEVIALVAAAVAEAEKNTVVLTPDIQLEILEAGIKEAEKEIRESRQDGPLHGGFILDNFPNTRDQWNLCIEKNLIPDDVVILKDNGEDFLQKRYYQMHKEEIDEKIRIREEEEERKRQKEEEDKMRKAEEERLAAEREAQRLAEEERKRLAAEEGGEDEEDQGEGSGEGSQDNDPSEEQPPEESGDQEEVQEKAPEAVDEGEAQAEVSFAPEPESVESDQPKSEDEETETDVTKTEATTEPEETRVEFADDVKKKEEKVPDGPEMAAYKEMRKEFDREFPNVVATITGGNIEPVVLEIETLTVEEMLEETATAMEKQYKYQGWEVSGMDIDEEEEDEAAANEEAEDEAEDEEDDPNRNKKKPLGDTNHYCPVALKETGVLYPGNPENAAKYREKVYYLSSPEARDRFLLNPEEYLTKDGPPKPPPIRLLLLGPRGCGKTSRGRELAKELGLFHISFKDRLQELIMHKTKRKIGPEYEELRDDEPEEDEDEDEAGEEGAAITDPSGKPVKEKSMESTKVSEQDSSKETLDDEPEFNDEEEAIKANLEADEALPTEILDNIVPGWWMKEPFKSTGFILEGFPRSADETRYLADNGLFPDMATVLTVEDADVIKRLLPPRMVVWKTKRDKRVARRQRKKEKAQKKKDDAKEKRRQELLKELEERKRERQAQKQAEKEDLDEDEEEEEEEEESEEEEDIEAILQEEFDEEEEEEEDEDELEDDAMDRLRNELNDMYDMDTNKLATVQDALEEYLIPRADIDGTRKPHIVRYILRKKLRHLVEGRQSMFERVYPISEKLANRMLLTGYKQPSRFGKWCPVSVKHGECIQTMTGPGYPTFPVIYRSHIYFMSSPQARELFEQDPIQYVSQPTPKPVVPIRLAIIGAPKSGKTTLANRFAERYGLLRLSIGEAMRLVMSSQPKSHLSVQMNKHLVKGLTVPDELAVQALEVCLLDMRCQTRGYVLDGFPLTQNQVRLMTERTLIPVRVLELELDGKEIMVRGTKDRIAASRLERFNSFGAKGEIIQFANSFDPEEMPISSGSKLQMPLHDSAQILALKLAAFNKEVGAVRDWYKQEHMNYQNIDAARSKWWVWNRALEISRESVKQIQTYLQRTGNGDAASIADMCITPTEFLQRMGDYHQYCPVSLNLRGELVDCSSNKTLKYAVEFRGHYYKCAGDEELKLFLAEPEKYVPPLAPQQLPPPEKLPRRREPDEVKATQKIELQGYCPVTYLDGKCRYEAIKPGKSDFIVEYMEKFWYCQNQKKLLQFMRLPEKYSGLTLPHKLPPEKEPMSPMALPMLGFMEQTVATKLIKALTACGNVKPKYPFLSASRSALFYIAYHLKAFNPKSSEYVRKKYKQKLDRFEETCHLISYLGNNMTVRYKEPVERPKDFDDKLQTFFALRGIEPTPTWIS